MKKCSVVVVLCLSFFICPVIYAKTGCMDSSAINYDSSITENDGSCQYEKIISQEEVIPYEIEETKNENMKFGKTQIIQKGENGKKTVTYKIITDANGKRLVKEQTNEVIKKRAVTQIVKVGNREEFMDNLVTMYTASFILLILNALSMSKIEKNKRLMIRMIHNYQSHIKDIPKEAMEFFKILFYIAYFLLIIPIFIDSILIIFYSVESVTLK